MYEHCEIDKLFSRTFLNMTIFLLFCDNMYLDPTGLLNNETRVQGDANFKAVEFFNSLPETWVYILPSIWRI